MWQGDGAAASWSAAGAVASMAGGGRMVDMLSSRKLYVDFEGDNLVAKGKESSSKMT